MRLWLILMYKCSLFTYDMGMNQLEDKWDAVFQIPSLKINYFKQGD